MQTWLCLFDAGWSAILRQFVSHFGRGYGSVWFPRYALSSVCKSHNMRLTPMGPNRRKAADVHHSPLLADGAKEIRGSSIKPNPLRALARAIRRNGAHPRSKSGPSVYRPAHVAAGVQAAGAGLRVELDAVPGAEAIRRSRAVRGARDEPVPRGARLDR